MKFFDTVIGMYVAQSVIHSIISVVIVEMSFFSLDIRDHFSRLRYRVLVLGMPILMFPLFQMINSERGSFYFRENSALFDSKRWLDLRVFDLLPVYWLAAVVLLTVTVVFMLQEIIPIIRSRFRSSHAIGDQLKPDKRTEFLLGRICSILKIPVPGVIIVDEQYPLLLTTGVKEHSIIVSNYLLERLDDDELESALAHEVVHMLKGSSMKTQLIYLLRMAMFYNPISLVEFRRLIQDDEFICDDITVFLTGKPDALAETLKMFYAELPEHTGSRMDKMRQTIESHSYNLVLKDRIAALSDRDSGSKKNFQIWKYVLVIIVVLRLNYFVV